jgi:hypothetical protein
MAYTALLSLEEFRDIQRRTEVRQQLHERFDQGLDGLAAQVKILKPTLEQLTQAVFALRQELAQTVTEGPGRAGASGNGGAAPGGLCPVWATAGGARPTGVDRRAAGRRGPAPAPVLLL